MPRDRERRRRTKEEPETKPAVSTEVLEDWAHRIASCADEAGDEELFALESDLLDIRDEIVFALHQAL